MEQITPNIIFILADDLGPWALGYAGNNEIRTPNIDRLAGEGLILNNFFCTSPVCSPARASILTGRIPSQHGVHDWIRMGNIRDSERGDTIQPIEYLTGQPGYTDLLSKAGYTCGMCGKWHLGDSARIQKGFSSWKVHASGGGPYYNAPLVSESGSVYRDPKYVTEIFTDWALEFLKNQSGQKNPFYLSVHYTAPHSPWSKENHPEDIWEDYYSNCPFESAPVEPVHPWKTESLPYVTGEKRREVLAGYYTAVTAMDREIGRILNYLDDTGLSENTIVIFTGDNGMNMGHHGIYGKGNGTFPMNMYDTSVKVPFSVRFPGRIGPGTENNSLLSQYDVFPTLLETAGIDNPYADYLPGSSFAPLLQGKKQPEREAVVVFDEYGPVRMIREKEWKYIHRYPYGPHELYNISRDPDERNNLIRDREYRSEIHRLRHRLDTWFLRYTDPGVDGSREGVTGQGQTGPAGPRGGGKNVWVSRPITFTTPDGSKPASAYSPFSEDV
ncbi:MAG: sulfatase-like hydrolase/transferase [Spirochaetia bacterium]